MKVIKFKNHCRYQLVSYGNKEPFKDIYKFKPNDIMYVDFLLEQHKDCIDVATDRFFTVLFGLKNEDFEIIK